MLLQANGDYPCACFFLLCMCRTSPALSLIINILLQASCFFSKWLAFAMRDPILVCVEFVAWSLESCLKFIWEAKICYVHAFTFAESGAGKSTWVIGDCIQFTPHVCRVFKWLTAVVVIFLCVHMQFLVIYYLSQENSLFTDYVLW